MPYIRKNRRLDLEHNDYPLNAGELNYTYTRLLMVPDADPDRLKEAMLWYANQYLILEKNYQRLNDVIGAMLGAGMERVRRTGDHSPMKTIGHAIAEFYERVVGPYEDTKIEENGDVYE